MPVLRALVSVLLGAGALVGTAAAARAAAVSPPVQIDVSSDTRSATTGDVVSYTVYVRNMSQNAYPHLHVSHQLPSGFTLLSSTPRASTGSTGPEWTVDLEPHQSLLLSDTAKAGTVAAAERLNPKARSTPGSAGTASHTFTTTVCASDGSSRTTLGCGDTQQALADAGPAVVHGWQPGLVGFGLLVAIYGALRGKVQSWQRKD